MSEEKSSTSEDPKNPVSYKSEYNESIAYVDKIE